MIFSKPISITDALRSSLLKRVLALSPDIGTQEIQENIPQAIRERAFFSARTPYAQYLADTQADIRNLLQPDVIASPDGSTRPAGKGESLSPAQVRSAMKQRLAALDYRASEGEQGTLKDLSSDRRINLIIKTQLQQSRGYGSWRQAQQPGILRVWPADELYRAINKKQPRNWAQRWNEQRAILGDETSATAADPMGIDTGPFVALKGDPIWTAINRFGNAYPPFDFDSGMRVRDVTRARAISLGVLTEDETVEPAQDTFDTPEPQPLPAGIPPELADVLTSFFGDFLTKALRSVS